MDNKKLGLGLLAMTGVCWVVTIIGMIMGGSGYHRWTEPFQQLGWIFFIAGFLVMYLLTGREIIRPKFANCAWVTGAIAIALFLVALVLNIASDVPESWFEAFEAAGSIAVLASIMTAIWSVGGWESTREV